MELTAPQEIEAQISSFEAAIKESQEWVADFVEEFEHSHSSETRIEVVITPEDVEKLNRLVEYFKTASDEDIKSNIASIKDNAPIFMDWLKGVEQQSPHEDIDAFDHTFNTFYYLDTKDLNLDEKVTARMTMLLHDIAKMNGDDRDHPRTSGEMVKKILEDVNLNEATKTEIQKQVTYHDFLGDVSRKDGYGAFRPQQMVEFFDNESQVKLHRVIVLADVASIPGLKAYLPNIERTFNRLIRNLDRVSWGFIPPEEGGEILDDEVVHQIVKEVIPYQRVFDKTDINDDREERREKFLSLPEAKQIALEKYLLQASKEFDDNFLKALQATGRETDESYIDELEIKYGIEAQELRLACHVFRATYGMWEVSRILRDLNDWESEVEYIEHWLGEIVDAGEKLSKMETSGTHCTSYDAKFQIDESGALLKSVGAKHYEGDGVYVGLMGSYSGWAEYMYRFNIKMEDLLPIIVNFNYPKMMANVLCDHLDIHSGEKEVAIPKGNIEWLHRDLDNDPSPSQVKLLEKYLGKVTRFKDGEDFNCFTIATEQPPIVWGMVSRALRIRNVIPEYELMYQYDYPEQGEEKLESVLPKNTAIRLKGVTLRELEDVL